MAKTYKPTEQHKCCKGDLVALQVRHRIAVNPLSTVKIDSKPYDTFHLGKVTKTNRQGRAERVQLFGNSFDQEVVLDTRVWTMIGEDKQAWAKALAASITTRDENEWKSTDDMRGAILATAEALRSKLVGAAQ